MMTGLVIQGLHAAYGESRILHDVSLAVAPATAVTLLGRNGAGKTTTLRCICGLLRPSAGHIAFNGSELTRLRPDEIVRKHGVVAVTEDRGIFTHLSVRENMELVKVSGAGWPLERILDEFGLIARLMERQGGALSGGEQQLVAIARALMLDHRLLLLDEPSQGLAPVMVDQVLDVLKRLQKTALSLLIVEQKLDIALEIASRAYILENGRIALESDTESLLDNPDLLKRHLGVGSHPQL
ncbi:MAG: ABC transporter ATP-binding protein [Castellaniella sp.]